MNYVTFLKSYVTLTVECQCIFVAEILTRNTFLKTPYFPRSLANNRSYTNPFQATPPYAAY